MKTILHSLNKAFLKVKPSRQEINQFKQNLQELYTQINTNLSETEEYHKNNLANFFKQTYYHPNYYINTKESHDLVIHNGKNAQSSVGVIIETKSPTNTQEMINEQKFNSKSLQQLLLYYLQERVINKNLELKHLIITNSLDFYVFPATLFEKLFYQDKKLIKLFDDFNNKLLSSSNRNFFYQEIAKPAINQVENELKDNCIHFTLNNFYKKEDEKELIILYKFFSPQHLLKQPFANDSNSLDEGFYSELLHIIGLAEVKQGSKKIIQRLPENQRHSASLLENTINQLDISEKVNYLQNPEEYGENYQQRLFNIALELVITWVNRILFLKLLEAQLISYNSSIPPNPPSQGGKREFNFLNSKIIGNFNDLESLFFQVLAKQNHERKADIQAKFAHIPYLNSSLFEVTEIERQTIGISSLNYDAELDLYSHTVLKDSQGKPLTQPQKTLDYLFNFLSAYDFSSEGSLEIQEDNKTLINASVLGLIFEKINGYQDGSYFTPGFITMYMCRETIRRAIIDKFNQVKGWHCQTIDDLYEKIEDKQEANQIINSIKICDPAVGSGHFLVSALNEIIALKSELNILLDRQGKTIKKTDYFVTVENDELIVTDEDNKPFAYNPKNRESRRIQEALFHEKQVIIENCLFGVDININSVKICRLRLWIELLKNAYYIIDENSFSGNENIIYPLQTLPNIDINIKCGNSLISRFDLKDSISSPKVKRQIAEYKEAVKAYRNPESKQEKLRVEKVIQEIKASLTSEITGVDKISTRLRQLEGELNGLVNQTSLFAETAKEKKAREKRQKELEKEINKLRLEIEDKRDNRIYQQGFEWRFEFPEILDDNGDFLGFDIIIGNPPYGVKLSINEQNLLKNIYNFGTTETAILFIIKGYQILKSNGIQSYIIPKSFTFASNYQRIRELTINELFSLVDCGKVWKDVKLEVCIFQLNRSLNNEQYFSLKRFAEEIKYITTVDKQITKQFDFFINGLNEQEISLGLKILNSCQFLNDISNNQRGAMLQQLITDNGDTLVIGGAEVQKYGIKGYKGKIDRKNVNDAKAFIKPNSILVQRIVAHIEKPKDHISITASIPDNPNYILVDTINQIELNKNINPFFMWALLHSKLINWYVYLFIFAKAIRTMQFDNPTTSKIPIPKKIGEKQQKPFIKIVKEILEKKKENPEADTEKLERKIDEMVYKLYGLTAEEIAIVEGGL